MNKDAKEKILTKDLREILKELMQKKIEALPAELEKLEPKERLNVLCRLMPFILPKVETVHPTANEPLQLDNW